MDGLLDFFSREAGQRRRAALDEFGRDVGYYVPPELRGLLGLAAEMTPSATIDRAAQAGSEMMAPGQTPMERVGSAGRMLSETAGVAAPMMVAGRAAMPAAQALQEGLLGFSMAADDVGRRVIERANQPGPVPTMYSNALNPFDMFHGTPDVRDVKKAGGFEPRTMKRPFIKNPEEWKRLSAKMDATKNADERIALGEMRSALREDRAFSKPIFMSPDRPMAASYADDRRAFDYQNAEPAVLTMRSSPQNILDVNAGGQTFRGISKNRVKTSLRAAGISDADIDDAFSRFIFADRGDGKMSTDDLGVVSQYLGFDAVDVANVKDAYEGGGVPGTVRMVFDPSVIDIRSPGFASTLPAPRNDAARRGLLE